VGAKLNGSESVYDVPTRYREVVLTVSKSRLVGRGNYGTN